MSWVDSFRIPTKQQAVHIMHKLTNDQIPIWILTLTFGLTLWSCTSKENYKRDLLSYDKITVDMACFELGELKDTSAIKPLFTKILDPRISNDLRFKGMSVNYCRLMALRKISGVDIGRVIDQFGVDTAATVFYLDWAVKEGFLKNKDEVDIYYYK